MMKMYKFRDNFVRQIIIFSLSLILVCLFNFYWIYGYWQLGSPYPILWRIVIFSCLIWFVFIVYVLPHRSLQKIFMDLGHKKLKKIFPKWYDIPLKAWIILLILSSSSTIVVYKIYPGLPAYLTPPKKSIVCCSGELTDFSVKNDTKTLEGKIEIHGGPINFTFREPSQENLFKNGPIFAVAKKTKKNWGKKLYAVNRGVMKRDSYTKIQIRIPDFQSPNPIEVVGKLDGIATTYPTSGNNGFYNTTNILGTEEVKLYIYPSNLSNEFDLYMKNKPNWWNFPILIALSFLIPGISFVVPLQNMKHLGSVINIYFS